MITRIFTRVNACHAMQRITRTFVTLSIFAALPLASSAAVTESFTANPIPATLELNLATRVTTSRTAPGAVRLLHSGTNIPSITYIGDDGQGKDDGLNAISFWYRKHTAAIPGRFVVEYSIENGPYIQVGNELETTSTSAWSQWSSSAVSGFTPVYGNNIKVRIRGIAMPYLSSLGCGFLVDDLSITDIVPPAGSPDAILMPAAYNFGILAENETSETIIRVQNSVDALQDLEIATDSFQFIGTSPDNFQVMNPSVTTTTLAPGAYRDVLVRYTAGPAGRSYSSTGVLKSNDFIPPRLALNGASYIPLTTLAGARLVTDSLHVKINGEVTATVAANGLTSGENQFMVQDASGADGATGLQVTDPNSLAGVAVSRGDTLVGLTGQLTTVGGVQRLLLKAPVTVNGTGSVAPRVLSGAEAFPDIQSELVQMNNTYFAGEGTWSAGAVYPFGSPNHATLSAICIAPASALTGQSIPPYNAPKSVIGIAGVASGAHVIMPRVPADVIAGTTGVPAIELSASSLDFGDREILLGRKGQQVVVSNTGTAPLDWTGNRLAFSGADAPAFSSLPTTAGLSTIWPGTTASLALYMDPNTVGPLSGTATLYSNDPAQPQSVITLAGTGTPESVGDWSQYMGNGEHDGRQLMDSRVTNFDQPIWQTPDHGLMGSAGPTVLEDPLSTVPVKVLAWGTAESNSIAFVKCFNGDTGALLWTSDPIADLGNSVAFSSWHSMAADKASGLAFLGMGSNVYAFNLETGALAWKSDTLRGDGGGQGVIVNATVTVGRDFVYQSTYTGFGGTNYLTAFRKTDGAEAWYHAAMGQGQETVVYHDDGVRDYIYRMTVTGSYPTGGTGMNCHDASTGEVIWTSNAPLDGSARWFTSDANFGGISFHDGRILAPTYNFGGTSQLVCVNAYTGALIWQANDSVATDTSPVVIGNRVYVCGHHLYGMGSEVDAFDLATGTRLFSKPVSASSNMWTVALAATNDSLYFTEGSSWFGSEIGGLHRISPETGDELSSFTVSSMSTRGSLAIGTDGSVYALAGTDPYAAESGLLCYRAPRVQTFSVEGHTTATVTPVIISGNTVSAVSNASWATEMRIYDTELGAGPWVPYADTATVQVSAGNGLKTFVAEYRNGSGETTATLALTIRRGSAVADWLEY